MYLIILWLLTILSILFGILTCVFSIKENFKLSSIMGILMAIIMFVLIIYCLFMAHIDTREIYLRCY